MYKSVQCQYSSLHTYSNTDGDKEKISARHSIHVGSVCVFSRFATMLWCSSSKGGVVRDILPLQEIEQNNIKILIRPVVIVWKTMFHVNNNLYFSNSAQNLPIPTSNTPMWQCQRSVSSLCMYYIISWWFSVKVFCDSAMLLITSGGIVHIL